jgi:hypothetical protein
VEIKVEIMTDHRKYGLLAAIISGLGTLLWSASLVPAQLSGQNGGQGLQPVESLFHTSDRCLACHNGMSTPSGEDVSIGFAWRPTMMANSSRDPYWLAGVRREIIEHPESRAAIEDECSICHMPMARYRAHSTGHEGIIFSHLPYDPSKEEDLLARDGVSCSLCHQITADKLGTRESFIGGFVVESGQLSESRSEYGPYKVDAGRARIMRSSTGGFQPTESDHVRQSELCATCHTLYTKALGPQGKVVGELPEQMPYQEWLHSAYKDSRSCQSCHMPEVKEPVPITPVFGEPRVGVARHTFVGANFFMLRLMNRHRAELGVDALTQELDAAAGRTIDSLKQNAARVSITDVALRDGRLEATIAVQNLGGHKFPSAYPSRRAWMHVTIRDAGGRVILESGALERSGLIRGNDNDANPTRFEPHYGEITGPDQVQIFEAIMVDHAGSVTTGLLNAVKYIKDNRLLPLGFDKQTAGRDIAVQGEAAQDSDFDGNGDSIRYLVATGSAQEPFEIEAELWYQPISYRWAQNLGRFDAAETNQFLEYYNAEAAYTAIVIARGNRQVGRTSSE